MDSVEKKIVQNWMVTTQTRILLNGGMVVLVMWRVRKVCFKRMIEDLESRK